MGGASARRCTTTQVRRQILADILRTIVRCARTLSLHGLRHPRTSHAPVSSVCCSPGRGLSADVFHPWCGAGLDPHHSHHAGDHCPAPAITVAAPTLPAFAANSNTTRTSSSDNSRHDIGGDTHGVVQPPVRAMAAREWLMQAVVSQYPPPRHDLLGELLDLYGYSCMFVSREHTHQLRSVSI